MLNSTDDGSQIRFGGYKEEYFKEREVQIWLETVNVTSWELYVSNVTFQDNDLLVNQRALINPGFPFIGMPKGVFETFKQEVIAYHTDDNLTCKDLDWCYFVKSCDLMSKEMPDLSFTFEMTNGGKQKFSVPSKSLLYSETNTTTGVEYCHLGVIGQKYTDSETWILGQSFMEIFYITFDATDADKLQVGIAYTPAAPKIIDVVPETPSEVPVAGKNFLIICVVICVAVFVGIAVIVIILRCYRKSQEKKLEKAKTYFNSLQTSLDNDDSTDINSGAEKDLETTDPNTFC